MIGKAHNAGYRLCYAAGRGYALEHILVVEAALGRRLPARAVVHHIDENRTNNAPSNLVACQDSAYHRLLHLRMRALAAAGTAHARRCAYCKRWDEPSALVFEPRSNRVQSTRTYHRACNAARLRAARGAQ